MGLFMVRAELARALIWLAWLPFRLLGVGLILALILLMPIIALLSVVVGVIAFVLWLAVEPLWRGCRFTRRS